MPELDRETLVLIYRVLHVSRGTYVDPAKRETYYRERDAAMVKVEAALGKKGNT